MQMRELHAPNSNAHLDSHLQGATQLAEDLYVPNNLQPLSSARLCEYAQAQTHFVKLNQRSLQAQQL